MISVTLIGAGNVAQHLYKAFSISQKVLIHQWFNRDLKRIECYKNDVQITNNLSELNDADIFIISVSDDAIVDISKKLLFSDKLTLHTSGSINMHHLDKKNHRGVFYPLQTFTENSKLDFKDVPVCIEVERKSDYNIVKTLALELGGQTLRINSDQRAALHLAAVFVNNFTNQLFRVAHEITETQGVDFDILKPLISETAKKIQHISPYMAQTGPALRGDETTIKKHLELLDENMHKSIYELLTKAIKKTHGV